MNKRCTRTPKELFENLQMDIDPNAIVGQDVRVPDSVNGNCHEQFLMILK